MTNTATAPAVRVSCIVPKCWAAGHPTDLQAHVVANHGQAVWDAEMAADYAEAIAEDAERTTATEAHAAHCIAASETCAYENMRDADGFDEGRPYPSAANLDTIKEWALGYLADGTKTCTCPAEPALDRRYLDKLNPERNCPGFKLWDVLASDGVRYLMAGDHEGGAETRLFFAARLTVVTATLIGANPDAAEWDRLRL